MRAFRAGSWRRVGRKQHVNNPDPTADTAVGFFVEIHPAVRPELGLERSLAALGIAAAGSRSSFGFAQNSLTPATRLKLAWRFYFLSGGGRNFRAAELMQ